MGTPAVLDRFRQIAPTVLIACDGVTHSGRDHDCLNVLAELRQALPSVRHTLLVGNLNATVLIAKCVSWTSGTARNDAETTAFEPLWLPFDHPLWIVYSSGTTGLPKPIVHGHGGMLLVQLQLGVLAAGAVLDDGLKARLHHAIRTALSPRFLPDGIFQVADIPRTLSGKKQELPIKKLLLGQPLDKVLNPDAMANPHCLDWYVDFARERLARLPPPEQSG